MPTGDSADALREVWMEGYNKGLSESGRKSAGRADKAQDEVARLACENAALRKRVEELERDVRVHDVGRWLSSCTPAERSEVAFYADVEGFKARAEKAERELSERDALLGWIDQALKAAHPDADVSDFGRSFEIVRCVVDRCLEAQASDMRCVEAERERDELMENHQALGREYESQGRTADKLQADLDAALVLCVASDWDVEVLGAGYEPEVYKAHAHVLPLLEKRREGRG